MPLRQSYLEAKDIVMEAVAIGNAIGASLEDGKITLSDVGLVVQPLIALPAAIAGATNASFDFTPEEEADLQQSIQEKFDIPQEELEAKVEKGIALAIAFYNYIREVI